MRLPLNVLVCCLSETHAPAESNVTDGLLLQDLHSCLPSAVHLLKACWWVPYPALAHNKGVSSFTQVLCKAADAGVASLLLGLLSKD